MARPFALHCGGGGGGGRRLGHRHRHRAALLSEGEVSCLDQLRTLALESFRAHIFPYVVGEGETRLEDALERGKSAVRLR